MKEKLTIVKVGGKIVEEAATLNQLLSDFRPFPVISCWCTVVDVRLPELRRSWVSKVKWLMDAELLMPKH